MIEFAKNIFNRRKRNNVPSLEAISFENPSRVLTAGDEVIIGGGVTRPRVVFMSPDIPYPLFGLIPDLSPRTDSPPSQNPQKG